jgi:hypothetical protein
MPLHASPKSVFGFVGRRAPPVVGVASRTRDTNTVDRPTSSEAIKISKGMDSSPARTLYSVLPMTTLGCFRILVPDQLNVGRYTPTWSQHTDSKAIRVMHWHLVRLVRSVATGALLVMWVAEHRRSTVWAKTRPS